MVNVEFLLGVLTLGCCCVQMFAMEDNVEDDRMYSISFVYVSSKYLALVNMLTVKLHQ